MENEFINKTIFGKFKLINLIGKGSYSLVFSALNLIDKSMVAVKIQDKSQIFGNLEKEAYYLYILKGTGIPKIISYGIHKKYYILVEQLLGKSLQQLFISNTNINKLKRKKDIIIASIQVLDRIEFIHSKLILHLDIKPDNFLIEKSDSSLIYVIDFGFAKKYRSSRTGKHITYSKKGYFNGNLKYSSVNTMKGVSPSRRDDLESLGYMIIYLYNQKLPWEDLPSKSRNELAHKIYELKKSIKIENLCLNMPEEMVIYMNYVKSLKFEQEPNYNYLRDLFQNLLKKIDRNVRPHFSWINRPLTGKDSDFLGKSYKKRRKSPFSKILNKFMNKSALDAKMPKLQLTNNLKLQSLEKGKEIEMEIEKEKEKNLTQRMKDFPQMIINKRNSLYIGNSDYNLEKDPINKNEVFGNENLNKNSIQIISKRLEIKKNNIILRNQYNNMLNNYNTKFINTAKNRIPIIDNGNITPSNIQISDISGNQNSFNPSTGNSQKSINYNFVINPYIANKTINIYSNNSSLANSSSKQQKIRPQNQIKKIIMSKHNSSNNMNKISPKNSFPFNRNASNMYFEITDYKNIEKKNNRPNLGNTNLYFENNITYKRKFGE